MIIAVIDSNVIASSVVRRHTPPGEVMTRWRNQQFELAISQAMIDEVSRTVSKAYFTTHAAAFEIRQLLEDLALHASVVTPGMVTSRIATHPEDDIVLATAVAAAANYLVTGDRQLQRLDVFRNVRIVSPATFLDVLAADAASR